MTDDDIRAILQKLQYQVRTLGQIVDYSKHPIEALIFEMDWTEGEIDKMHDIFERWDARIRKGEALESHAFEHDFSNELGVSYQRLKSIILAVYRNGQWTRVCEAYVDSFGASPSIEYHQIMQRERD